ncbi:hypothetical protein V6N12_042356 [Hibiscus sabdariffa]|uniref:Uncharacterized protein n=1 Tax=Hibiscus sabdariffa TaxID=183260 RepID=A0ABR2EEJ3_9ROSI
MLSSSKKSKLEKCIKDGIEIEIEGTLSDCSGALPVVAYKSWVCGFQATMCSGQRPAAAVELLRRAPGRVGAVVALLRKAR